MYSEADLDNIFLWFTVKSYLFVGHLIQCISLVEQSLNLTSQWNFNFSNIKCEIWKPWFHVSTNMSNVVKPQNLVPMKWNDFTVPY